MSKSKKAMSTKYSAIGTTIVPLSQQMRNSNPRSPSSSTPATKQQTDNFFDDILADWDQPDTANKKENFGIGIHNNNNDVSSSSSLAFTPTPPSPNNQHSHSKKSKLNRNQSPSANSNDRSIYILRDDPIKDKGQIPENSNYTQHIFDDIITINKPTQNGAITSNNANTMEQPQEPLYESEVIVIDETIRNDPNYLPPPDDTSAHKHKSDIINSKNAKNTKKKKSKVLLEPLGDDNTSLVAAVVPSTPDLNPWAHLNKTIETNIMEAPVEDIDNDDDEGQYEDRGFLKHEADDIGHDMKKKKNITPSAATKNIFYCIIFVIGIVIGVLLTISLIRHKAIDANYLFGPTGQESENDSVIAAEIGGINVYDNSTHIIEEHEGDDDDVFEHIRGNTISPPTEHNTKTPTLSAQQHSASQLVTATDKPTLLPTGYPSPKPSTNPYQRPTHSPVVTEIAMTVTDINSVDEALQDEDGLSGLVEVSNLNENDDEILSDANVDEGIEIANKLNHDNKSADDNDNDTAIQTADYHHVHAGIEIANELNQENETNDNIDNVHSPSPTLSQNAESNQDSQQIEQKEDNPQSNIVDNAASKPPDSTISASSITNDIDINQPEQQQSIFSQSDSAEYEDSLLPDTSPLCNVIPQMDCNSNQNDRFPLPFDKPLSAQLQCHQNTCRSPPSLPGQLIISGETFEAGRTILDIQQEIPIKCHTKHLHSIKVQRNGYHNNEDWKYCIRISNDNTLQTFPVLHVSFSLISFDIEQGFDNLFITTQFNDIYDDYAEVWTGNWSTLHRFEPNTWYQNFWMTSAAPNAFAEFCLRLQSDESIVGRGFVAKFSITQEMGFWSEWSLCTAHSNSKSIANGACGIGVQSHESYCPADIVENTKNDNDDRFDWSNGTHSCINKYSNYPLNKYCIVAACNDIDNDKYAPIDIVQSSQKRGNWDNIGTYIYNGRTRIDPQYADPFNIIMNTKRYKIDLNELRNNLQSEIDNVLSRYPEPSQNLFAETFNMESPQIEKLGVRLLSSLLLGRIFTFVTTGSSNTAGHDNVFMSAYPMQLQSLMQVIWNKYSVYGGGFRVRNQAVGGHLGTPKQGPCISALIGTYDKNIDIVSWESFMNDGTKINPSFEEIWLRNILLTYNNSHSQPFLSCVSTNDKPQAGCRTNGGRYVFNSFLGHYANATGVSNYYGQYVCNAHEICNDTQLLDAEDNNIKCVDRPGNEACTAAHVSWHPSPHRHRVMAETFAVTFMRAAVDAIDRLYDNINDIIVKSDYYPSYGLACLLEEGVSAGFQRPLTKPIKCPAEICEHGMWCAISFWPTPKHNQLHRYFVNANGFYNNDTIDLPVDPLVMRNGGRASIDHKAQWLADRYQIGAFLEIYIKVPTRYIMIVYPQGTSRIAVVTYFDAFQFLVNGIEKQCEGTAYDMKMSSFCLLDCEKPGKYILKLVLVNDTNPALDDKQTQYAIDEIAGI